jgi:hypothetical protein
MGQFGRVIRGTAFPRNRADYNADQTGDDNSNGCLNASFARTAQSTRAQIGIVGITHILFSECVADR